MSTVIQTARAFCQAKQEYHQDYRDYFHNQVEPLDADRFWQLQPVFSCEVYKFRFGYDRTNGIEHAASEFFRKPYVADFTTVDGPDAPKYTLDEAVRFAQSWREISRQLHEPLLDCTTIKSSDSYGDLLDSLPLAGRIVVDRCLRTENHDDAVVTYDQLREAVRQACGQQKYPELSPFILNGENYVGMCLIDAAREYFALQASQATDASEVNQGQTKVILNVYGGLIQDVFCSDPEIEVTLVDWDTHAHRGDEPELVEVQTHSGQKAPAYVADFPANPLSDLADTDVALALEKAEACDGQT